MLKVLINAVSAKSGGAVSYIRNLADELVMSYPKYEFIFVCPSDQVGSILKVGRNIKVILTEIGQQSSWKRFLWDQIALRRIIQKEKVVLLISSSDFGVWFPPCRQILMIRNSLFFSREYLKKILPQKSLRFKLEFFLRRWFISLSAKSSDAVVTASKSMMEAVRRSIPIPDGKAVVNCFGVSLDRFARHPTNSSEDVRNEPRKPFQILYVSEYSDYKNLTTLLKALPILRETGKVDFCLVSTLDPSQFSDVEIISREEDKTLASSPQIAPFVKFTGSIPYDEIPHLYRHSDLFVFASLAESFGHPLVEAMASELPIIASDIPICREICGEAAVYFNPLDPENLAEKIIFLWNNPDLMRQMGQKGRKRVETHFDWKDHARRLVDIIEQVMAKG